MNRKLLQLFQASLIAALVPLTGCLAEDLEEDDVALVEDEIEIGVVPDGGDEQTASPDALDEGAFPGADDLDLPELDVVAFGESMPGGDRMAEPIPYPWDDPKEKGLLPDDPSDPAPNQN
mgnify:CR=1 FL=1